MQTQPEQHRPIQIISAGAGSGKTYTLTGRLSELLRGGLRAGAVMATTFTQKAAAELQDRVRVRLLEAGMTDAANELPNALIGTVHSIGIRLLQRFAFEAGVSPLVEVIAETDGQRLFNESLAQVLSPERIEEMNLLSDRLGLTKKNYGEPFDWRRLIREITDAARANNFSEAVLRESLERSWRSFARLLPPPADMPALQWQNQLIALLDQTVETLGEQSDDDTKLTRDAAESLEQLRDQYRRRGALHWYEWVKIAKTKVGAKSRERMEPLRLFALRHTEHPQFHADNRRMLECIFELSADALREFERYKNKRGLIDYTDMETQVRRLLRVESVRRTLAAEIDLLFVDEFQDTSPIQLDIFLQLSSLARHSVWVGDPKQSIYGFRGAEPALMQAIIEATGGIRSENILRKSWRSRPQLVHAANAIFTKAFDRLPAELIALEPALPDPAPDQPALLQWHFISEEDERKAPGQPWMEHCIARRIRSAIEQGMTVWDKKSRLPAPARPGDFAVLCRNNADCTRMAEALHQAGLQASIARAGLFDTPECRLVIACLKYLVTPSDQLSAAEMLLLSGAMDLETLIDERLEPDNEHRLQQKGFLPQLHQLRPLSLELSASEILNLLLDELDIRRMASTLGNSVQRLDNVDKLRAYALEYESACQRLHSAASLSGFLLWLGHVGAEGLDLQGSGEHPDAVNVLTYHKSKGLEYPIAICHNLDAPLRERVWGLNLESDAPKPDLDDILGGRYLRLWLNPYADQIKNTPLEAALLQSPEYASANRQALDEETRLLYVGLTRARDYLVFPTNAKGTAWLNRVFNHGNEDAATLDPNADESPFYWDGRLVPVHVEQIYMPRNFEPILSVENTLERPPASHPGKRPERKLYALDPRSEGQATFTPGKSLSFANPVPAPDPLPPKLADAMRSVLLADSFENTVAARRALAAQQSAIRELPEIWTATLAEISGRFRQYLADNFPSTKPAAEFPLSTWQAGRKMDITIDWLLDDGKTLFPLLWGGLYRGAGPGNLRPDDLVLYASNTATLLREAFPDRKIQPALVYALEGIIVYMELRR